MKIKTDANDLAKTLKEYEVDPITPDRIMNWVQQFPKDYRELVLVELNHIYQSYFWTKDWVRSMVIGCMNDAYNAINKRGKSFLELNFIRTQNQSKSQSTILNMIDEIIFKTYTKHIEDCGGGDTAFYIDDCSYTGNRIHRDIQKWSANKKTLQSILHLRTYLLGAYTKNSKYSIGKVDDICSENKILHDHLSCMKLENNDLHSTKLQCYAPAKELKLHENQEVVKYTEKLEKEMMDTKGKIFPYWRDHLALGEEKVFTSKRNRLIVEGLFLVAGCKLHNEGHVSNQNHRPMGYHYFKNLGFGAINVSYRNIPNNAPLVLWWGTNEYPALFQPLRTG